ncbi:hypothetical protein TWF132_010753 [Orbilia oligospora]|nr:hypothetical protein TWF751_002482 [Orbilia oligospora]KAF3282173.1 hypothetical protein TWF132_010753 [Orbilia oligospora]
MIHSEITHLKVDLVTTRPRWTNHDIDQIQKNKKRRSAGNSSGIGRIFMQAAIDGMWELHTFLPLDVSPLDNLPGLPNSPKFGGWNMLMDSRSRDVASSYSDTQMPSFD